MQRAVNCNIAAVFVIANYYWTQFWFASKDKAINRMNNANTKNSKEIDTRRIWKNYHDPKK